MTKKIKAMLAGGAFLMGIGCGILVYEKVAQEFDTPKKEVIEDYKVRPYDTLWTISEKYRMKDCRDPYILEYKNELEKLNPGVKWGSLQTGTTLKIKYYVEEEVTP